MPIQDNAASSGDLLNECTIDFAEDIDDEVEANLTPLQISQAVLYASDWTTETIISQLKRGNININPTFQRRDAWPQARKSRFIESLVLGLPIPQIVLAEKEKGKYLVLDGKQRLNTLLQFAGLQEGKFNKFKLKNLDVRFDLNNKNFDDFENDPSLQADLDQFNNHTIRSVVIRNWPNIDFLHLVFVRLNTESVKLSPQELRQALFPGDFMEYVDEASCKSPALKTLLRIKQPDFRMRDMELLIRFLSYQLFLGKYSGNLKKFLDEACERINNDWESFKPSVEAEIRRFEQAITIAEEVFGRRNIAHKFTEQGYENRLNRALLDVIAFYFSDEKMGELVLEKKEEVRKAYELLCISNEDFRESIERTTKSLGALSTRLNLMGRALMGTLGADFNIPQLSDNRIQFNGFWRN